MRGLLRTGLVVTAAISAAVTLYLASTLPPASVGLDGGLPPGHVPGAYHIHTNRSDGTGAVDEIAAAAGRAGLKFIVLTDHGDGTRVPDAPTYRHDVLVIDAVELNTREGHAVALGLNAASSYPIAGLATDVAEDVHRLGGVVVMAHPDSPRNELAWRGGPGPGPAVDGVEWLNADSEWRDDSAFTLLSRAAQSILRPSESVAALFSRPVRSLQRWDTMSRQRPTFGLAAVDAHANIGWRENEEPRQRTALARPTYETMFRTLTQTAIVDEGLSGDATTDAARVLAALTSGRSYSSLRAYAWPAGLTFTAQHGDTNYTMGARVRDTSAPLTFQAASANAPGARLTLLHNGRSLATGVGQVSATGVTQPGVYRVEVQLPGREMPWIVSNPITIEGPQQGGGPQLLTSPASSEFITFDAASAGWNIEHDPSSSGATRTDGNRLQFDYQLGPGISHGQYAAIAHGDDSGNGIGSIRFVAQASAPMRLSLQIRLPEGRGRSAQRWRRSVYVDTAPRTIELRLQDFEPADRPTARRPIVTPLHSVLFVVDTVNSLPGSSGTLWLSDVALGVNRLN